MRTATRLLPLLTLVSACALAGDADDPTIESTLSGTASISLASSSTRVSLTSDSQWSLAKTGSLSGNTVTWNITATKTATQSGQLLIQGQMTVTNTGTGPATIGNIVVNLQKRVSNKWVTASSDIADATSGDAATSALIHKAASSEAKSSFSETAGASGSLEFMDATNNTLFSLVPQVLIPSGTSRTLLFSATFNNNHASLQLAPGTTIRAEVIVSFGNATASGNSTANVDINGSGSLDADEARVRSVPSRLTVTVPAPVAGNSTVTLTDTAADITPMGTVTFTNAQFNLGATSGTVTATVNGGASGGTITNCAHLTGADQSVTSGGFTFNVTSGVDLLSCSTVTVPGSTTPPPCTPGTAGCPWQTGSLATWNQFDYGASTNAAGALLTSNFLTFYSNDLVIGGTFVARFSSASAVFAYLPQTDPAGRFTASSSDPTNTSAGELGGELVALTINLDFSDAGVLTRTTPLRDLYICNYAFAPSLNGMTIGDFYDFANVLVGGGPSTPIGPTLAAGVANDINNAFRGGNPSTFAQDSLRVGGCTN